MDIVEAVIRETTEDFVETFSDPENCMGVMARFIADGILPEAVDPEDERVKAIITRCKALRQNTGTTTDF